MEFYVLMSDGSRFGPVDMDKINEWIKEGRVLEDTVVERMPDGARGPASMLPGAAFAKPVQPAAPHAPSSAPPKVAQSGPEPPKGPIFLETEPTIRQTPPAAQAAPTASAQGSSEPPKSSLFKETEFVKHQEPPASLDSLGKPMSYVSFSRAHIDPNVLPDELRGKFNWGAFFFTWLWGLFHRAYIPLLSIVFGLGMIPFGKGANGSVESSPINIVAAGLQFGFAIFLGFQGNNWAWKSGRFSTPEECRTCQNAWGQWGCAFFAGALILAGIGIALLIFVFKSILTGK